MLVDNSCLYSVARFIGGCVAHRRWGMGGGEEGTGGGEEGTGGGEERRRRG